MKFPKSIIDTQQAGLNFLLEIATYDGLKVNRIPKNYESLSTNYFKDLSNVVEDSIASQIRALKQNILPLPDNNLRQIFLQRTKGINVVIDDKAEKLIKMSTIELVHFIVNIYNKINQIPLDQRQNLKKSSQLKIYLINIFPIKSGNLIQKVLEQFSDLWPIATFSKFKNIIFLILLAIYTIFVLGLTIYSKSPLVLIIEKIVSLKKALKNHYYDQSKQAVNIIEEGLEGDSLTANIIEKKKFQVRNQNIDEILPNNRFTSLPQSYKMKNNWWSKNYQIIFVILILFGFLLGLQGGKMILNSSITNEIEIHQKNIESFTLMLFYIYKARANIINLAVYGEKEIKIRKVEEFENLMENSLKKFYESLEVS